jgi:hypothetical protein
MSDAEMYPLVDNPTYLEAFETFQELKEHCEATFDGLNFPLSWFIYDESDEDWGKYQEPGTADKREFSILNFMPRKSQTAQWSTSTFDPAEVHVWLSTFVKTKVMEWYGWLDD